MLIEATQTPITYKLRDGQIVVLLPGVPVDLPDKAGQQLLTKAGSRVRLAKEALRQQQGLNPVRPAPPTIAVGDRIEWTRAGQAQQGLVDFVHVDDTGATWAFVTIGETWAAVNLKFAQGPAQLRLLA
jgi:plastocyanin